MCGLTDDAEDEETKYLLSIPGMLDKIETASLESIEEGFSTEELWVPYNVKHSLNVPSCLRVL